jgi:hypothetical protein
MPIKLKNNVSSTLASAISASDVGLTVAAGTGAQFPTLAAGDYFYATLITPSGTIEVVKVTARVGDTMTVVRAQEGSSAAGFAAGTRMELRVTAQSVLDAARYTDTVSVTDFGARPSASGAVNLAAIQSAINASSGKKIYIPGGIYNVAGTITVNTAVVIEGDGTGQTFVAQQTPNVDTFLFQPTTAGVTAAFLNGGNIRSLNVSHGAVAASSTTGAGIRFVQCNGYRLFNVSVNNAPEGITIMGGQLGSLKSFQVFASSGLITAPDTALLYFRQAPYGSGLFQPCYTVEVEDFRLSASKLRETCIYIRNADGAQFTNGYVAFGSGSLVRVQAEQDNSYVAAVGFTNVYFDCVGAGNTPNGITIAPDGFTNSFVYGLKIGSGCVIGNGDQIGVLGRKPQTMLLSIEGATILNMTKWAVDVEGATSGPGTDLHINGCQFQNNGDSVSGAIRASTGRSLNIVGNTFSDTQGSVINVSGTFTQGTITGNSNSSAITELSNSATFTNPLVLAGNSGRTVSSTTFRGLRPGNVALDQTNTLDWYEEGTFTPTLNFGGSSTGITYSSQVGNYTRIGNVVFFNLRIFLTAKGSATGTAGVGILPFVNGGGNTPLAMRFWSGQSGVGEKTQSAILDTGTATMRIFEANASGQPVALTNTAFLDDSFLELAGSYRCV